MALKKRDTSHNEVLIIHDDSEVDRYVSEPLHINTQHIKQSTYSDLSGTQVHKANKQIRSLFIGQGEFDYQQQTDGYIGQEDVFGKIQEELFYPDVPPEELGQKIKSSKRKKVKVNLKKVSKVKQSKIDPNLANAIDL